MSNRAWMPLHIDDYIRDTDHLSASEHGAYLLLIMKYWRDGGLPSDEGLIRRYAKLSAEQWAESRDVIAAFFEDGWRHKRIDAELAKADEIIEKRRSAAKERHERSKSNANAKQVHNTSTSICSDTGVPPVTNNLSEPSGSDAPPAVDARQLLWSEGLSILVTISGKPNASARQLLGKWLKASRDDCALVMSKILAARDNRVGEPVSWITAAISPQATDPPRKPRNAGELARMQLKAMSEENATGTEIRHINQGDGDADHPGFGLSRRFAIATSR